MCRSWAVALPVPQLSIRLGVDSATATIQPSEQLRRLLELMQQDGTGATSALRGAPALVLTLDNDSHTQQMDAGLAPDADSALSSGLALVSQLVSVLQHLQGITISVAQGWRLLPAHCQDGAFSALLQLLAALQQHQATLRSLTLSCSSRWSEPQALAAALQQLPGLAALQLQHCPVAALAQLPSLPRLQRLAVTGRPHEPVPPSYSIKQRPLLPHLPGLTSLVLVAMPVDLVTQEAEGIRAWQQQQQQRQAGATAATSSHSWRSQRQWVSASIAVACPALQVVASSAPLCKPLLLQPLRSLRMLACPEVAAHEPHRGGAHRGRFGCAHTVPGGCMQLERLAAA